MFNTSIKSLTLSASTVAVALMTFAATQTASAHPHNLLAMCELPNGTWVSCDLTVDGPNGHEPKSGVVRPGKIKNLSSQPKRQRNKRISK